ncbi:MAG: hypothetical protein WBI28_03000 [Candidatus Omnitrophota bacterium]
MKKGQSTLEYVIIITAIVAGIIFAATTFLKPRVQNALDHATSEMESGVEKINFSGGTSKP